MRRDADIVGTLPILYYLAASINPRVIKFFEDNSDFMGEIHKRFNDSMRIALKKSSRPDSEIHYRIAHGFFLNHIYSLSNLLDNYVGDLNENGTVQYPFTPHLFLFLAAAGFSRSRNRWFGHFDRNGLFGTTQEYFSDSTKTVLSSKKWKWLEKVFFFRDDGPIPAFDEPSVFDAKDKVHHKQLLGRYNSTGRCLERRNIIVDWSFTNDEIVNAFKDHVTRLRSDFQANRVERSSGYWANVPLMTDTCFLLRHTEEFIRKLHGINDVRNSFEQAIDLVAKYPVDEILGGRSEKGRITDHPLYKISKSIMTASREQRGLIDRTKKMTVLLQFLCQAFNLPSYYKSSYNSMLALPTHASVTKRPFNPEE